MKVNIWHIDIYAGFDDYEYGMKGNKHFDIAIDSKLTKQDIEDIFFRKYNSYRSVAVVNIELIKTAEIDV